MSRRSIAADFVEAGAGPLVVLVHASMSGVRQWGSLVHALQDRFCVRAVNLFGYGRTPAWTAKQPPTLGDYADLVASAVPAGARGVALVGHSFGGAVAMQAAHRLGQSAAKLVLIEPSIFSLLRDNGRREAFAEIAAVAEGMTRFPPEAAAERFIGYWAGPESWAATPPERKAAYVRAVATVAQEFAASFGSTMTLARWARSLPQRTLVLSAADTKRSSREVVELLASAAPAWEFAHVAEGGHMSPLTQPQLVNPVIASFLAR